MQRRYKDEKQLQTHLDKVVETCCIEWATQKVRKMAKAKAREKAKKWMLMEEKEKRKQLKYLK